MSSVRAALSVGAGVEQLHAVLAARALGFAVIAVDRDANAPAMAHADFALPIDIANEAAVIEAARRHGVELVIPAPIGRFLTTIGAVNDALGLKGLTRRAASVCVDKRLCNQVMREADVAAPPQTTAAAWRSGGRNPLSPDVWPKIVKPRFGSGGRGIRVCDSPAELEAELQTRDQEQDLLVEDVILGAEFGVDAAIFDGGFTLLLARRKIVTDGAFRADMGYVSLDAAHRETVALLGALLQRAVQAAGLTDCLIHADLIVDRSGRAHVIEFSGRPAGMGIHTQLLPRLLGFDAIGAAIRHLGGLARFTPPQAAPEGSIAMLYVPFPPGRVHKIGGIDAARQLPGILEVAVAAGEGLELGAFATCSDALMRGYVMAAGDGAEHAEQRAQAAVAAILNKTRIDGVNEFEPGYRHHNRAPLGAVGQ